MRNQLIKKFGRKITKGSIIAHEVQLKKFIELVQPSVILEIGTFRGISAALWASCGCRVITIDIRRRRKASEVWEHCKVGDKIEHFIVSSEIKKRNLIQELKFDLAFIDGDHSRRGVSSDFDAVKHCGQVLFHDYKPQDPRFNGIVEFIDELEPKCKLFGPVQSQFAYWAKDSDADFDQEFSKLAPYALEIRQKRSRLSLGAIKKTVARLAFDRGD